ncbi:hypothetical protein PVIIG_06180 [Plasmodium vivax India VII]|uniref:PIR Superfamily Protein n=1 Tax=Plasmodium vivax India VII TaxID=1077284 RepID=A0A0J9UUL1_PLAVI|nr:hypothetical protein PVIIG_06180 [Plasmodium vivax India VII]
MTYGSHFFPESGHYEEISQLCERMLNNLDSIIYKENDSYNLTGKCKLLNYWLHDKVNEILVSDHAVHSGRTLDELYTAWNSYIKTHAFHVKTEHKCEPDTTLITLSNIEDKKRIHEHCLNYHKYIKESNNIDECKKYENYIKEKLSQYHNFENILSEDKKLPTNYCKTCKNYNPENISASSKCSSAVLSSMHPIKITVEDPSTGVGVEGKQKAQAKENQE